MNISTELLVAGAAVIGTVISYVSLVGKMRSNHDKDLVEKTENKKDLMKAIGDIDKLGMKVNDIAEKQGSRLDNHEQRITELDKQFSLFLNTSEQMFGKMDEVIIDIKEMRSEFEAHREKDRRDEG